MSTASRRFVSPYMRELFDRGREEGKIMAARELLAKLLELEESLSAERRAEFEACADLPTLDGWLEEFAERRSRSEN